MSLVRTLSTSAFLMAAAAMLSACATMAPSYERPDAPVAAAVGDEASGKDAQALIAWRDVFTDPTLQALIETALENNRDLRVATLNVERARAQFRVQRANSVPSIDATGGYTRQRVGPNASTGVAGATVTDGDPVVIEQWRAGGAVSSYELDLFGRVRSLNNKALESYFATEETRKAAQISLIAEVASAYSQLAATRELLMIARDTVDSQEQSLALTTQRRDNGIGTEVDVLRAVNSLETARADAAALESQAAQAENALRLLLGVRQLPSLEIASTSDISIAADLPAGAPSSLLLERPDVMAAERTLQAANANIGAARAAFFPRILLTANAGSASAELSDLFSGGTKTWTFAPTITLPIFTGGANLAQLKAAKVDRDIALAEYESAIQSAFRDAADALAARATIRRQLEARQRLADAAAKTYDLTEARYRSGVDDYLSVLDAQRSDYSARNALVSTRLNDLLSIIDLYRALGGYDSASANPIP